MGRWTIKRKRGRTRYHTDSAVAGPFTDWVDVVDAADLDRAVEGLREIVAKGDRVVKATDGENTILVAEPRAYEECAAIARSTLATLEDESGEGSA